MSAEAADSTTIREGLVQKFDVTRVELLYIAMFAYNFLHGLLLGNFSGLLSTIKSNFNLSTGQLGDLLSTASIGAVTGMLFIPQLISDQGSRVSAFYATFFFFFTYLLLAVASATNTYVGIAALICMGLGVVWMDSSMNTQAAIVETIKGFPLFGRLQAVYSIGAVVGALVSARLVDAGLPVYQILLIASTFYFPVTLTIVYTLMDHAGELVVNEARDAEKARMLARRLAQLGEDDESNLYGDTSMNSERSDGDHDETEQETMLSRHNSSNNDAVRSGNTSRNRSRATSTTQYGTVGQPPSSTLESENRGVFSQLYEFVSQCIPLEKLHLVPKQQKNADVTTLAVLSLVLCLISFGESAVTYFSELFVENNWTDISSEVAVFGFVGFEIGTAVSRFFSDFLVANPKIFGTRRQLIFRGSLLAGLSFLLIAVAGFSSNHDSSTTRAGQTTLALAVVGFVFVGVFEGPMVPLVLGFASNLQGFQPGDAIPLVSAWGMIGIVFAPLVDGNVVDWVGYSSCFLSQGIIFAVASFLAFMSKEQYAVKKKRRARRSSAESSSATSQSESGPASERSVTAVEN